MISKLYYRDYLDTDFKALLDLLEKNDEDFYPPLSKRGTLLDYLKADLTRNSKTFLAQDNKKIIGFINVQLLEDSGYINTIVLDKEYRNQGVGSVLMQIVVDYCGGNNFKTVKTRTWSTNVSGLKLYRNFGFKNDYIVNNDRGNGVDSIYLIKIL